MMYVDHVATTGTIIDPDRPLFSGEYIETTSRTFFISYGSGPRLDGRGQPNFRGDPKATIRELARLPAASRAQQFTGRDPGVVHAPLYYYGGAAADWLAEHLDGKAMPTRMFWVRAWSALLGALAVYGAWLLGAQVFGYGRKALLVGLLVATQPMISYWSGLVSNDIGAVATAALVLAQLAFMLRHKPHPAQGLWLGGLLATALLTKSTALVLVVLAAATLAMQAIVVRHNRPAVIRSVRNLVFVAALPVVAWYGWSLVRYGTLTGEVLVQGAADGGGITNDAHFGIDDYLEQARAWFADVYRTSWFHFAIVDAPRGSWIYFAPGALIAVCWFGVVGFAWDRRHTFLRQDAPELRQAALCLGMCFLLTAPFLRLDLSRAASGSEFFVNAGRLMLPAYAAFAVLGVLGLDWLIARQAKTFVLAALGAASSAFLCHVWEHHFVVRYFGEASWGELFHRMSFDRPWFIVPGTYWATVGVVLIMLGAFAAALVIGCRPSATDRSASV